MNTADRVDQMIREWKAMTMAAWEIVVVLAQACVGWPYVFGARGKLCNPSNRKQYASSAHETVAGKCQVLSGKKAGCVGCRWYPGGNTRMYDCRGFTYWVLMQVGIRIEGAGATSQWNNDANWEEKGAVADMPKDKVCCLFKADGKTMEHTGLWLRNDMVIHCSGEVKEGKLKNFTHYAVPKGLYEGGGGDVPERKPTLRRGDKGAYVVEMQTDLQVLGYDLGKCGVDGDFGRASEKALKAFQKAAGIGVDGICGPASWAALDKEMQKMAEDPPADKCTVVIPDIGRDEAEKILGEYAGAYITDGRRG